MKNFHTPVTTRSYILQICATIWSILNKPVCNISVNVTFKVQIDYVVPYPYTQSVLQTLVLLQYDDVDIEKYSDMIQKYYYLGFTPHRTAGRIVQCVILEKQKV